MEVQDNKKSIPQHLASEICEQENNAFQNDPIFSVKWWERHGNMNGEPHKKIGYVSWLKEPIDHFTNCTRLVNDTVHRYSITLNKNVSFLTLETYHVRNMAIKLLQYYWHTLLNYK